MGHVFLMAFEVVGDNENITRAEAQDYLLRRIHKDVPVGPGPFHERPYVDSWWEAEDDREDGSDNDSAVFVNPGAQAAAFRVLRDAELTEAWNNPRFGGREPRGQWEAEQYDTEVTP